MAYLNANGLVIVPGCPRWYYDRYGLSMLATVLAAEVLAGDGRGEFPAQSS